MQIGWNPQGLLLGLTNAIDFITFEEFIATHLRSKRVWINFKSCQGFKTWSLLTFVVFPALIFCARLLLHGEILPQSSSPKMVNTFYYSPLNKKRTRQASGDGLFGSCFGNFSVILRTWAVVIRFCGYKKIGDSSPKYRKLHAKLKLQVNHHMKCWFGFGPWLLL